MIRILVADDHTVVREGLKQILADSNDIIVAGEATNGCEVLNLVSQSHFDVILLDIAMPDMSGLDVLGELKTKNPNIPVMILSIYPEEQYAVRMLKAGAAGYLTKDCAADELLNAIRKVDSGGKYVSGSLAEKLAFNLETNAEKHMHERLSDREYQVMCLVAIGKPTTEIAETLSLSPKTVNTYRSRIFDKMKLKNNVELARYAIKHQLVS